MEAARALTGHPRIDVTGLEAVIGTRYTYDTLEFLVRRCPGVHFVWIMGADNLRSFHRWQNWRDIAELHADRGGGPRRPEPLRRRWPGRAGARRATAFRSATARTPGRPRTRRPGSTCTASNRRCRRPRCEHADRNARG